MTFSDYVRHGWALCPIREGEKAPRGAAWNKRENAITDPERAGNLSGAGLCHAFSGTCAIDIDNMDYARAWLAERGVDLDALFSAPEAVQITRGDATRGKLLYKLPVPLPTKQIKSEDKTFTILEFRCSATTGNTAQDVLPPTIHPSGKPYQWKYDSLTADWRDLPELPESLHRIWNDLVRPVERSAPPVAPSAALDELRDLIADHDPDMTHDEWVRIGQILHHETEGSEDGLALWNEWSSKGTKYKGCDELAYKWGTFGHSPTPVTAGSLRRGKKASRDDFEDAPIGGDVDLDSAEREAAAAKLAQQAAKWQWRTLGELALADPGQWLIDDVLPKQDINMLFGPSGAGKSFVALDMALAIARGIPWRDLGVLPGTVCWIAAEAEGSMRNRFRAYAKRQELDLDAVENFRVLGAGVSLADSELVPSLCASARPFHPVLVVVDTLAAASGGVNENSGEDMGQVLDNCRAIHRLTGATVLLVHHAGKDQEQGARGWSGIRAAVHAELSIKQREGSSVRDIIVTKMRDGTEGAIYPFKLEEIAVGLDHKDRPIKSAVVTHIAAKEAAPETTHTPAENHGTLTKAMRVLRALWPVDGEPVIPISAFIDAYAEEMPRGEGEDKRHATAHNVLTRLASRDLVVVDNACGTITLVAESGIAQPEAGENNDDLI